MDPVFADTRHWGALANAADVLSNAAFLAAGLCGFAALVRARTRALSNMERAMAALFFAGLVATAACSGWFHLHPDAARLAIDRSGMAIAFAGLLGLVMATHAGEAAAAVVGLGVLLAAPASIAAAQGGNIVPWAILQFGGMLAVAVMAFRRPRANALAVNWLAVVAIYGVAKLFEVSDAPIFEATGQWVSGHTLKHLVAACAAIPVIVALRWHNAPHAMDALAARLGTMRRSPQ